MARTKRYDAFRRYLAGRDEKIKQRQSEHSVPEQAIREGTQKWIQSVGGGARSSSTSSSLRLCPFAAAHRVSIEICTFPPANDDLEDYAWLVYKAARELFQKRDANDEAEAADAAVGPRTFRSCLVVFPHYQGEIGDLYEAILEKHKKFIGGVNDVVPQKNGMSKQRVQAIPLEGYDVNESKLQKGLPTRPITAMAPWTTIQLIAYSDFEKLPMKLRQRIMKRNDERENELSDRDKLDLLRNCRYVYDDDNNNMNSGSNGMNATSRRGISTTTTTTLKSPGKLPLVYNDNKNGTVTLACLEVVKRKRKASQQH